MTDIQSVEGIAVATLRRAVEPVLGKLPVRDKKTMVQNLKSNWLFLISALAMFCLNIRLSLAYLIGIPIALFFQMIVASQIGSVWRRAGSSRVAIRAISFLASIGCALGEQAYFYTRIGRHPSVIDAIGGFLPASFDVPLLAGLIGAIASVPFLYFYMVLFWEKLCSIVMESHLFRGMERSEGILYSLLLLTLLGLTAFAFSKSSAYYGATDDICDVIYTSDSAVIVRANAYLALTHPENDLRQPLFALFAAPFVSVPYLIARVFSLPLSVQAVLENSIQLALLLMANFMLARALNLSARNRVAFMLLLSCTYPQILFSLMMEQYIIAYFWLIFAVYLSCAEHPAEIFALCGAGGTLLPSLAVAFFMPNRYPLKNVRWLQDVIQNLCGFFIAVFAFCRLDVSLDVRDLLTSGGMYRGFMGQGVPRWNRLAQYTDFICGCFSAPKAAAGHFHPYLSSPVVWQLLPAEGVNAIGVAIFALAIVSAIFNRKKKSSRIAATWVFISVMVLLAAGWGMKENGLILYSLYFGWSFFVLLFQLVEIVGEKLRAKLLVPVTSLGCGIALLLANAPSIAKLMEFAETYYPIGGIIE